MDYSKLNQIYNSYLSKTTTGSGSTIVALEFEDFKVRFSNVFDLYKDHFKLTDNQKDNSIDQKSELFKILFTVFSSESFWNLKTREQTNYLVLNALASWSNYNHYYFISEKAYKEIDNRNIDLSVPITRHKIFNVRDNSKKKILTFEHVIPVSVQREFIRDLFDKKLLNEKSLKKLLHDYGIVSIITQEENRILSQKKLSNKFPCDISRGESSKIWNRYVEANIRMKDFLVPVYGKMYR